MSTNITVSSIAQAQALLAGVDTKVSLLKLIRAAEGFSASVTDESDVAVWKSFRKSTDKYAGKSVDNAPYTQGRIDAYTLALTGQCDAQGFRRLIERVADIPYGAVSNLDDRILRVVKFLATKAGVEEARAHTVADLMAIFPATFTRGLTPVEAEVKAKASAGTKRSTFEVADDETPAPKQAQPRKGKAKEQPAETPAPESMEAMIARMVAAGVQQALAGMNAAASANGKSARRKAKA